MLGKVHRVAGRPQEAKTCLQNSVENLAATGNRLELGRSCYELGLALTALGLEEGPERLQEAAHIFAALGVAGELERARAALADGHRQNDGPC